MNIKPPKSTPLTIKVDRADYKELRGIAAKHSVTISSTVRFATSLGLPKVLSIFKQLEKQTTAEHKV